MTPTRPTAARDDHGFSLIEVVIAVALLLFITTAVYKTFDRTTKQVTGLQRLVDQESNTRNVMSGMQSELRNAFSGDESVPHITTMTATTITFTSADRGTPLKLRRITYNLTGGTLTRTMATTTNTYVTSPMTWTWGTTSPARTMATGVVNTSMFAYKDDVGLDTTDPKKVRLVEVLLSVKSPKAPTNQQPETYSTSVRMRGVG